MPENETTLASQVFEQLQRAMACDPEGFTDLYRDYLADAWQMIAMLRDAVQQQQAEEVRAKAHRLKGSSMVLGACAVAQCAAALEELGHTTDVQGVCAMLERTQQALQQVQSELAGRLGAGVVPAGESAA
jgi:HPt (histidine-containing phosphotransfer) domain-containing protein